MMTVNPEKHIETYCDIGVNAIIVHAEAVLHHKRLMNKIKSLGILSGIAINPSTDPEFLNYIIDSIDIVTVMSVDPGYGMQSFMKPILKKISRIKEIILNNHATTKIEVDGGVNPDNIKDVVSAGADMIVSGSYSIDNNAENIASKIQNLKSNI